MHKKTLFWTTAIILLVLAVSLVSAEETASESYKQKVIISDAGTSDTQSNNYKQGISLFGIIGSAISSLYKTFLGFFYSVTSNPPLVTLYYPVDQNHTINLSRVILNCSAYDNNLENISLYSDYRGTWQEIEKRKVNQKNVSLNFTIDILSEWGKLADSEFKWNCLAVDNESSKAWAEKNFTFSSWNLGKHNWTILNGSAITINHTEDNYTKLLLHFNGPDDSKQDSDFKDDSGKNHNPLPYGDTKLENTQRKFGETSAYLDGTGDYIFSDDSADWDFDGSNDNTGWTIDFWARFSSWEGTGFNTFMWVGGTTALTTFQLDYRSDTNKLRTYYYSSSASTWSIERDWNPDLNKWYHIALSSENDEFRMFVDGIQLGDKKTQTAKIRRAAAGLYLGLRPTLTDRYFNGYIDELRITKGKARWTANFTPPSREYSSAEYKSRIFDAGEYKSFTSISWDEALPYGEELPNSRENEELTKNGGINMSGNVLLLHFNNNSDYYENNSLAYDFSEMKNNATCSGSLCPVLNNSGKLNKAYSFDGSDDRFIIKDTSKLSFGDSSNDRPLTISLWIYPTSIIDTRRILVKDGASREWVVMLKDDGADEAQPCIYFIDNSASGYRGREVSKGIKGLSGINNWYHLVFTYDGRGGSNAYDGIDIYVNGILSDDANYLSGTYTAMEDTTNDVWVGRHPSMLHPFQGKIDEIAIWNRTLSETEILNIYKRGALTLNISTRTSGDGETWSSWSKSHSNPSGLIDFYSRFIQYKVNMQTQDTAYSPKLLRNTVNITYSSSVDALPPKLNSSINNSAPKIGEVINISANISDDTSLQKCVFIHNQSGSAVLIEKTISGTSDKCSQNYTIYLPRKNTINFTIIAYDNANRINQSDYIIEVANTPPPKVTLLQLPSDTYTTNRTPLLAWENVTDADGDRILFNLKIKCIECSVDDRDINTTRINMTPGELQYLGDDGYYYNWSVSAIDNSSIGETEYGEISDIWNFTINSLISINFTVDSVDFGSINIGENKNTTTNSPSPFILENDGNVFVNISIYAEKNIWDSVSMPSDTYQFKIANTTEIYSFNWTSSLINFTNFTSIENKYNNSVVSLNYNDSKDSAEIDLKITTPLNEGPGQKSSRIVVEARRSK